MKNTKLVGHHVGGRNATVSFLPPSYFQCDFVNVLYDADAECVEQILEKTADEPYEVKAFPYCLGAESKLATFNINYCSYTSSMYELNERFGGFYDFTLPLDYMYSDTMRTMERVPVEIVSLDSVLQNDTQVPAPDFLSLDVEGMEDEVLEGAANTLAQSVLGVVTEITFLELRKGQALFEQLRPLLDQSGFDFVRFTHLFDYSPHRGPVGARGEGYQLNGDALFIRRLDSLPEMTSDLNEQYILATKLAFIAVHWGLLEYAMAVMVFRQSLAVPEEVKNGIDDTAYGQFLTGLEQAIATLPKNFPPLFSEVMDYQASRSRSQSQEVNIHVGWKYDLKEWLLRRPGILNLLRRVRYAGWSTKAKLADAFKVGISIFMPRYTKVERHLISHGFEDLARLVRSRRLVETPHISRSS